MSGRESLPSSPRWANAFLERFCAPALYEEVRGDLEELYHERLTYLPSLIAKGLYWGGVLFFLRAHTLRQTDSYTQARGPIMWSNYMRVALRHNRKQKGYALINVTGLAIGIACCLLILLYVRDEHRYDAYYENAERLYRVTQTVERNGQERLMAWSPVPLGPALEADLPETEATTRFWRMFRPVVSYEDKHFQERAFYLADPAALSMFSFAFLRGDPATALNEPNTIVLTASKARTYFGDADPIGKVLSIDAYPIGDAELRVTGVIADLPHHTHVAFDGLGSLVGVEREQNNWGSNKPIWTYVQLPKGYEASQLNAKFPAFIAKHYESERMMKVGLEPIRDIYLHSTARGGFKAGSDAAYSYLFGAVGLFILLLACINFTNLTTARSLQRAREVGMRKVLGARRGQLIGQFLAEAFLTSTLALLCAVLVVEAALPGFNAFTGKMLSVGYLTDLWLVPTLIGLVLGVGLLAGGYPAFILSRFQVGATLKGSFSRSQRGRRFREGLVVLQFGVTVVLMLCTALVYQQMQYVQNKNLGFEAEQVVVVPYSDQAEPLLHALRSHPRIVDASVSQRVPVNNDATDGRTLRRRIDDDPLQVQSFLVDPFFVDTYGIEVIAGRNFSEALASDSAAFILNETGMRAMGWTSADEALGQPLIWSGYKEGTIVGIIRDFHLTSMHAPIAPQVLHMLPEEEWWRTFISVQIQPRDFQETLAFLESTWRQFTPEGAYNYFFIDDSLEQLHRADVRFGTVFGVFAVLAIVIACLGLLGLAAFNAAQRTKEIGVRKVMGASSWSLTVLLSRDVAQLVGVAGLISTPLAYFAMTQWLDQFAYRVSISPMVFVLAMGSALLLALLTVSYQTIKAARRNPVDALRYE